MNENVIYNYEASAEFINECKNFAYQNRYGEIYLYSSQQDLTQSDKIQEFSIDSGCYVNGEIIGVTYAKKCEAKFINALDNTFENEKIEVAVGAKYTTTEEINGEDVESEVIEYIDMGIYVVEKPKDEQTYNYSSIVAYDTLALLDQPYTTEINYEGEYIFISDIFEELCNNLGLFPPNLAFTNSTIRVENNPFTNGETNRVVLNAIAKVACSFVEIVDEAIYLKWLSNSQNPDYTFELSDYSSLEGGKSVYGPINGLIIKSSMVDSENVYIQDAESIQQYGEHILTISEDYFLYNQEKKQEAIYAIWNKVHNLTYTECNLTTYTGKPFLKIGDKIRVYTDDENYIDTYVLQHNFKYDGTFQSVIKAPLLTDVEVAMKQSIDLGEKLRQTEIIINKQQGIIEQNVAKTNEIDTTLNNNYQELKEKFNGYAPTSRVVEIENSVQQIQTDTYTKTEINTKLIDGSVQKVQTASATFDESGMTYRKTDSEVETTINEVGVKTKKISNNKTILFAGYVDENNSEFSDYEGQTIVATDNIIVQNYLVIGTHSRLEDYESGTGCFYIG